MNLFLQLLANGVVNGVVYALLAVAFGLVYRSTRVFHVAFAGLFLVGPYTFYVASQRLGLPYPIGLCLGIITGGLAAWLSEVLLYHPFLKRRAAAGPVIVASLGAYVILVNVTALIFGNQVQIIDRAIARRFEMGMIGLTSIQFMQFIVGVFMLVAVWQASRHLKTFKIIWAIGEEPELIPVLGLPLHRFRGFVFVLSGMLCALAGCMIGYDVGMDPHMGMRYLLIAAVAVLAGGLDSYAGWVLGGLSVGVLHSLTVWLISAKWTDLTTFSVLIVVLLFRPQGILGTRRRLEEM